MGLLFNDTNEIKAKVEENFNDNKNFLVAMKHNDTKTGLAKLVLSNVLYIMDSARTFILYFSPKGIYEKEISNSSKGNFTLLPTNEIEGFDIEEKSNKTIIKLLHLGKKLSYEIPYKGQIFTTNEENLQTLKANNWNMI